MFERIGADRPGLIPEAFRSTFRRFAAGVGALMLIAWAAALYAATKAPWVEDLFHLINPGAPPPRPESTATYLFWYPTVLTIIFMSCAFAPDVFLSTAPRRRSAFCGTLFVYGMFVVVFFAIALNRAISASFAVSV